MFALFNIIIQNTVIAFFSILKTLAVVLDFISLSKFAHENIFTISGNNTTKMNYYLNQKCELMQKT